MTSIGILVLKHNMRYWNTKTSNVLTKTLLVDTSLRRSQTYQISIVPHLHTSYSLIRSPHLYFLLETSSLLMACWSPAEPPPLGHVLVMLKQGFFPGDRNYWVDNILSVLAPKTELTHNLAY